MVLYPPKDSILHVAHFYLTATLEDTQKNPDDSISAVEGGTKFGRYCFLFRGKI